MARRSHGSSLIKKVTDRDKKTSNLSPNNEQDEDKGDLTKYIKDLSVIDVLQKKGIKKLFPIQYQTYDILYSGKDIVAKDRTGSGKTIAFSLPVLMRLKQKGVLKDKHQPKFLIVLPTRQLAIQVCDQIKSLKTPQDQFVVDAVYGGSSIRQQIDIVKNGIDILVGTPGRLIDFINRGLIDFSELHVTCLDEADQMLNMGFKQDIQKIFQFVSKSRKTKTQNLLFSATIPQWIWSISNRYQDKDRPFIDLIKNGLTQASKTVQHFSIELSKFQKNKFLQPIINNFLKNKQEKRVIIFSQTKRQCRQLKQNQGLMMKTGTLHGDMKQYERQTVFKQFKNGQLQCIVATNVAARGLDFPQIDLVIQLQPPKTTDTYIHRSGRTGRAGKDGVCVTIYNSRQVQLLKKIEQQSKVRMKTLDKRNLENVKHEKSPNYDNRSQRKNYNGPKDYNNDRNNGRNHHNSNDGYNRNDNRSRGRQREPKKPYNDRNRDQSSKKQKYDNYKTKNQSDKYQNKRRQAETNDYQVEQY